MALRIHDQPKLDNCFTNTSVESFAHSLLSRVFVSVENKYFYEKYDVILITYATNIFHENKTKIESYLKFSFF